jgi:hypothetical protein
MISTDQYVRSAHDAVEEKEIAACEAIFSAVESVRDAGHDVNHWILNLGVIFAQVLMGASAEERELALEELVYRIKKYHGYDRIREMKGYCESSLADEEAGVPNMRDIEEIKAQATKLADEINHDDETGADAGLSKHWLGRRTGILEALRWLLEEIDFDENGHTKERVSEKLV